MLNIAYVAAIESIEINVIVLDFVVELSDTLVPQYHSLKSYHVYEIKQLQKVFQLWQ